MYFFILYQNWFSLLSNTLHTHTLHTQVESGELAVGDDDGSLEIYISASPPPPPPGSER